jgi:Trk-type K+ transport system membrane component
MGELPPAGSGDGLDRGRRATGDLLSVPYAAYVSNRDVYLSVTLAWVVAALLGGVPFLIEGTFDSLLDSTFEAMSGFTTTGSTLLSDIEAQTPSILFWRSMTQWLGGIGIVVLFVAVAPVCINRWKRASA